MNLKDILFIAKSHGIKPDASLSDILLAKKLDKGVIRTISGNPLHFSARKAQKAQNPSLSLSPIQDLHGYDHAWIGGMGKNLLDISLDGIKDANTTGTWSGNIYTIDGNTFEILTDASNNVVGIKVNGTFTAATGFYLTKNVNLPSGSYIINGCPSNIVANTFLAFYNNDTRQYVDDRDYGSGGTVTLDDSSYSVRIRSGNNAVVNNAVFKPMVRLSSVSDGTFAPYKNICPINGRESADVDGCGKNLAKPTRTVGETWSNRGVDYVCNPDYSISMSGTYSGAQFGQQLVASVTLPAGTYVFNGQNNADVNKKATLQLYNPVTQTQLINKDTNTDFEFTLTETTYLYINIGMRVGFKSTEPITMKPMIRRVEDDYVYEPYVNQTDITFTFGQTVYGCTINFDTGVMSIDTLRVDLGTMNWNTTSTSGVFYADDDLGEFIGTGKTIVSCDSFLCCDNVSGLGKARLNPNGSMCGYSGSGTHRWYIRYDGITSKTDLIAAVNGVYACYKLATPQTIQLTPQEINLLKGVNNIWTDGDSIELTYRA